MGISSLWRRWQTRFLGGCMRTRLVTVALLLVATFSITTPSASALSSGPGIRVGCWSIEVADNGSGLKLSGLLSYQFIGKSAAIDLYINGSQYGRTSVNLRVPSKTHHWWAFPIDQALYWTNSSGDTTANFKWVITDSAHRKASFTCRDVAVPVPVQTPSPTSTPSTATSNSWSGCFFNGHRMYGAMYVAPDPVLADVRVYVSSTFTAADEGVYVTTDPMTATSCGVWYLSSSPSYSSTSVAFVRSPTLADLTIYLTPSPSLAGRP